MTPEMPRRVALGFTAACVVAVGLYGVLRVVQFFLFPDPNPALVIWSAHAGYFWRIWTVGYAGGMAGLFAFFAARRDPARVVRVLLPALTIAAVIIFAQGVFVP
jgi:hypothetical protein